MEFIVHNKARFSDNFSDEEYKEAQLEYFHHLNNIDFSKVKSLLKYFGGSFFHDAELVSLRISPPRNKLELQLITINDLEDINTLRRKHALSEISIKEYNKSPLVYNCSFNGFTMLQGKLDISESNRVMDTELHIGSQQDNFRVIISFSETEEIEFYCRTCVVKIDNQDKILKYTDGQRKTIPYCSLCRSKLLNRRLIDKYINMS